MQTLSLLIILLLVPLSVLGAPVDAPSDSSISTADSSNGTDDSSTAAVWTMKCDSSALDDACIYNKNGQRYCDAKGVFHSVTDPGTCNKVCHCIS